MKRLFDLVSSTAGLTTTLILYPFITIAIKIDSKGPIFYRQERIGLNGSVFNIIKFRTMVIGADKAASITTDNDKRITKVGSFLRKSKLDELPTLINVLIGDMSIVGPRPELKKYVDSYTKCQKKVLSVKPGITDLGTLEYDDEINILGNSVHSETIYITKILPNKLALNLKYVETRNFLLDLKIIIQTVGLILKRIFR